MKISSARELTPLVPMLLMILAGAIAAAGESDARLTGALDLTYAGHLEKTDDAGRLLVWEGSIAGDFSGKIRWWFVDPSPAATTAYIGGTVNYYEARWEI